MFVKGRLQSRLEAQVLHLFLNCFVFMLFILL